MTKVLGPDRNVWRNVTTWLSVVQECWSLYWWHPHSPHNWSWTHPRSPIHTAATLKGKVILQLEEVLLPSVEARVPRGWHQWKRVWNGQKEDLCDCWMATANIGLWHTGVHQICELLSEMDTCILWCGMTTPQSLPEGPWVAMDREWTDCFQTPEMESYWGPSASACQSQHTVLHGNHCLKLCLWHSPFAETSW